MSKINYKLLAKLFTSSGINRFSEGDYTLFFEAFNQFPHLKKIDNNKELFEEIYTLLFEHYPNEYVVKNSIVNKILLGRHSLNTASMLNELRIGENKADCVIINGLSTCYEIKTKFDSLKRLPEQLAAYTSAFDKTFVVTHKKHFDAVCDYQSKFPIFGVILIGEQGRLSKKIEAPINDYFDTKMMFHSLRKAEYTYIAKCVLGEAPLVPDTLMFDECKKIFCSLPSADSNALFKKTLKLYRKNDSEFINALPKSMKNIGISYKLHKTCKRNILLSL